VWESEKCSGKLIAYYSEFLNSVYHIDICWEPRPQTGFTFDISVFSQLLWATMWGRGRYRWILLLYCIMLHRGQKGHFQWLGMCAYKNILCRLCCCYKCAKIYGHILRGSYLHSVCKFLNSFNQTTNHISNINMKFYKPKVEKNDRITIQTTTYLLT